MAISSGRRISVILDTSVDEALSRISAFTGQPVATLVREVLQEAEPAFKATADAFDLAKTNPQRAVRQMVGFFDDQMADAQQTVFPLRRKRGRKPKG